MDFLTIAIASDYKLVDPDRVGAQASKEVQDKTSNGHLDCQPHNVFSYIVLSTPLEFIG